MLEITFANAGGSYIVTRFTFAFVSVGSVYAFTCPANVRPQNTLVDFTQMTGFLTQLSVRVCMFITNWEID